MINKINSALVKVAKVGVKGASDKWVLFHQPEVPAALAALKN